MRDNCLSTWISFQSGSSAKKVAGVALLLFALSPALPRSARAGIVGTPIEIATAGVGKGSVPLALLLLVAQSGDGQSSGSLQFNLSTKDGVPADIVGLFFNVQDESLLSGLTVQALDASGAKGFFEENAIDNLGNGANLKGTHLTWDAGVKFDKGFSAVSFLLTHSDGPLELENFFGSSTNDQGEEVPTFGARAQSVGGSGGGSKLVGYLPYENAGLLPPAAKSGINTSVSQDSLSAASAHPAPEPTSLAVWGLAVAGLGFIRTRRQRRQA